jgi:hypothetical protein
MMSQLRGHSACEQNYYSVKDLGPDCKDGPDTPLCQDGTAPPDFCNWVVVKFDESKL